MWSMRGIRLVDYDLPGRPDKALTHRGHNGWLCATAEFTIKISETAARAKDWFTVGCTYHLRAQAIKTGDRTWT
jgi:hypothetical protein